MTASAQPTHPTWGDSAFPLHGPSTSSPLSIAFDAPSACPDCLLPEGHRYGCAVGESAVVKNARGRSREGAAT